MRSITTNTPRLSAFQMYVQAQKLIYCCSKHGTTFGMGAPSLCKLVSFAHLGVTLPRYVGGGDVVGARTMPK
jgi:hypothetical protein